MALGSLISLEFFLKWLVGVILRIAENLNHPSQIRGPDGQAFTLPSKPTPSRHASPRAPAAGPLPAKCLLTISPARGRAIGESVQIQHRPTVGRSPAVATRVPTIRFPDGALMIVARGAKKDAGGLIRQHGRPPPDRLHQPDRCLNPPTTLILE
jgi:hypothetical protein